MHLPAGAATTFGALAVGLSTAACSSGSSVGSGPPACSADGGTNGVPVIPASGTVTGSDVSASICSGGAFATLEHTQGSTTTTPYILFISSADMGYQRGWTVSDGAHMLETTFETDSKERFRRGIEDCDRMMRSVRFEGAS